MPITPQRMPFLGHIAELRRRLTVIVSVLLVFTMAGYMFTDQIYRFIIEPMRGTLGDAPVVTLDVLEGMTNRFRLGLWAAVVAASPIIIYQVLAFFLPALKPKERRWFLWTFAAAAALFLAGAAFCYLVVLETAVEWLALQNGAIFEWLPRGSSLLSFAMWIIVGFGLAFEVPVVVFYLVYFGVVPYDKLRANWRVVWIVIIVAAAVITPDWSPVSMGLLSGAMVALYETSMALVRVLLARKIKAQKAASEDY